MNRTLSLILAAGLLTAATPSSPPPAPSDAGSYLGNFLDPSVAPGDDFFHYAVGKWLRENPIPANERSWGIGHVVQEETYQRLLSISETAAAAAAARGTNEQKIGDFWHAGMDTTTIAQQGITPLEPEFARIDSVRDTKGLMRVVARLQTVVPSAALHMRCSPSVTIGIGADGSGRVNASRSTCGPGCSGSTRR